MRLTVEKWICTTLKKSSDNNVTEIDKNSSKKEITTQEKSNALNKSDKSDLVIEQRVQLEQKLYEETINLIDTLNEHYDEFVIENQLQTNQIPYSLCSKQKTIKKNLKKNFGMSKSIESSACMNEENEEDELEEEEETSRFVEGSKSNVSINWQSLIDLLSGSLDMFSHRESIGIIQEIIKLSNYLTSESNLNDQDVFFTSQQKIIENLNKSLKDKLFSISQSVNLFNEQKKKLESLLTKKLTTPNLSDAMSLFESLESQHFDLLDYLKLKIKIKISKFEKHLHTWNEFDFYSNHLKQIFDQNNPTKSCGLEYRGLLIEISNYLNKLKENLNLLASICEESKYFELKNAIIVYELKFKQLKEKHEQKTLSNDTLRHVPAVLYTSNNVNNSQSLDYLIVNSKNNSNIKSEPIRKYHKTQTILINPSNRYEKSSLNEETNSDYFANKNNTATNLIKINNHAYRSNNSENLSRQSNFNNKRYETIPIMLQDDNQENLYYSNNDFSNDYDETLQRKRNKIDYLRAKKSVETSDKSTFTVCEISTQTDNDHVVSQYSSNIFNHNYSPVDRNNNSTPVHRKSIKLSRQNELESDQLAPRNVKTYFVNCSNGDQDLHLINREYKSKTITSNIVLNPESDGKKLLLEAYLRNNNNNASNSNSNETREDIGRSGGGSSSSSASIRRLSCQNLKGNQELKTQIAATTTTTTTRESGVGTLNDDEMDSLQSANRNADVEDVDDDYFNDDFNDNLIERNNYNELRVQHESKFDMPQLKNRTKIPKLKPTKTNKNRSAISSSSTSISSSLNLSDSNKQTTESVFKKINSKYNLNSAIHSTSANSTTRTSSFNLIRKIFTFLLFLFPFLFLLFVYLFYIFFLNPSCCDFKRNYLLFNVS